MNEAIPNLATLGDRPTRWWWGGAIVGVMAGLLGIGWLVLDADITQFVILLYTVLFFGLLGLLIWWFALLRTSWRTKGIGVAIVAIAVAAFVTKYRFVGMSGAYLPLFVDRWEKPPAERQRDFYRDELAGLGTRDRSALNSDSDSIAETEKVITRDWPGFRGEFRDGIVRGVRIRTDWKTNPPTELWRHSVGTGWSGFAVSQGLAVTQEQYTNEGDDVPEDEQYDYECVVCYDAVTGKPQWIHRDDVSFKSSDGGDGPRATPSISGDRVYTLGATGLLTCLELGTGELIWQRNTLDDANAGNLQWGMAGSPLVTEDRVYVNPGGERSKGVIAYDRGTGEILWANGAHQAGYGSPRIETIDGVNQLLIFDGTGLAGLSLEDGRQLWRFPWENTFRINVAQPIVRDERYVFLGTGYSQGSALLDLKRNGEEWPNPPPTVWEKENFFKLKFNGAVYHEGTLYGIDAGILAAIDFMTGERHWKRGRYRFGQILLFKEQELILVLSESGELALVEATPNQFNELARIEVLEGKTWNHMAYANGRLYLRNANEAVCLQIGE